MQSPLVVGPVIEDWEDFGEMMLLTRECRDFEESRLLTWCSPSVNQSDDFRDVLADEDTVVLTLVCLEACLRLEAASSSLSEPGVTETHIHGHIGQIQLNLPPFTCANR